MSNIYQEKLEPVEVRKGKGKINRYKLYTIDGEEVLFSYIVDAQEALAVVDENGEHKYFVTKPRKGKEDETQKEDKVDVRNGAGNAGK